jgi:hypothetical protein
MSLNQTYRNPFKSEKEEFIDFINEISVNEWYSSIIPLKLTKKYTFKNIKFLALELFNQSEIFNLINSSSIEEVVFKRIKTELHFKFFQLEYYKYNLNFLSCSDAAKANNLKALKIMHEAGFRIDDVDVIDHAAKHNNIEMLQYAIKSGFPIGKFAAINSAANGHLEFLQIIIENNGPIEQEAALYATIGGHLNCLRLLVQTNHKLVTFDTYLAAARYGHLNCLEYLYLFDPVFDYKIPMTAANNGNLEVFQFLYNIFPNKNQFCRVKYNLQKMMHQINFNDENYQYLYTNLIY